MEKEFIDIECKSFNFSNEAPGEFEGYGAVFNNIDLVNDILLKSAVTKTISTYQSKGKYPALFFNHDMKNPVGEYTEMTVDDHGIKLKGILWVEGNSLGRKAIEQAEVARNVLLSQAVVGLSIGYFPIKSSSQTIEGKRVRVLEDIEIIEISVVHNPANPDAEISSIKSFDDINKRDLEKAVKACGLSVKQAKLFVKGGMEAVCEERNPELDQVCEEQDKQENVDNLRLILAAIKQNNLLMEVKK